MATKTHELGQDIVSTVTADTFETLVLNASGETVVEFMSYGCSHCHASEPIFQEVARTMAATQNYYRVNVAIDSDLELSYHIEGTPTFVMFLDGAEVGRVEGPDPTLSSLTAAVTQPYHS